MINDFSKENFFLSNFYMRPIMIYGITFPSSEHAFQAAKSLDENVWKEVAELKTAREAKQFGKKI